MRSSLKFLSVVVVIGLASLGLAGCNGPPRDSFAQWVARDQWDSTCAEDAIVEQWKAENGHWEIEGEKWVVDVDAHFKLVNKCTSGIPLVGKKYAQFEDVPFKATVTMSKCKKDGDTGWSLPQKEGSRCWTGPSLLAAKK